MPPQILKSLDWYAPFENLLGNGFLEDLGLEKLRFGVIHKKIGRLHKAQG
jgi:hypothetical protein